MIATRSIVTAFVVALAVWATGIALCKPARAHDPYSGWRPPDNPNTSCCDNTDCRPTRAYLGDDGFWRAWSGTAWLTIPPGKLLPPDFAKDGRNHLCEKDGQTYCFTPGQPKS